MAVTGRLPLLLFYEKSGKGAKTVAINRRDKTKTDRTSKVHKDWYKLDLSAIVYLTEKRFFFRLSFVRSFKGGNQSRDAAAGGESDNASFSDV